MVHKLWQVTERKRLQVMRCLGRVAGLTLYYKVRVRGASRGSPCSLEWCPQFGSHWTGNLEKTQTWWLISHCWFRNICGSTSGICRDRDVWADLLSPLPPQPQRKSKGNEWIMHQIQFTPQTTAIIKHVGTVALWRTTFQCIYSRQHVDMKRVILRQAETS